jgi:hypothetical protein
MGNNRMCISGQVYYTKSYKKNGFYESRLSYKGVNDEQLARPKNLNLNSRGGVIKNYFFIFLGL